MDIGVDGLTGRVGDAMLEIGDDVGEAAFEHAGTRFIEFFAANIRNPNRRLNP